MLYQNIWYCKRN